MEFWKQTLSGLPEQTHSWVEADHACLFAALLLATRSMPAACIGRYLKQHGGLVHTMMLSGF